MSHRDRVERLARERSAAHHGQASSRPLAEDYQLVGLCGELAFAERFGLTLDATLRPGGDGGIDFRLRIGSVDVKTSRRKLANTLRVEAGKVKAAIYVLASYDERSGDAYLVGWEYGTVIRTIPPRTSTAGVLNHYRAASKLRPIDELVRLELGAVPPAPEVPTPAKARPSQTHIRPECDASEGSAGWRVWVRMAPAECRDIARVAENYGYKTTSQFLLDVRAVMQWHGLDAERAAYKVCQGAADGEARGVPGAAIKREPVAKPAQERLI